MSGVVGWATGPPQQGHGINGSARADVPKRRTSAEQTAKGEPDLRLHPAHLRLAKTRNPENGRWWVDIEGFSLCTMARIAGRLPRGRPAISSLGPGRAAP
ncbi:hypothetical protein GCM10027615_69240 [Plantactinospora veratri]